MGKHLIFQEETLTLLVLEVWNRGRMRAEEGEKCLANEVGKVFQKVLQDHEGKEHISASVFNLINAFIWWSQSVDNQDD